MESRENKINSLKTFDCFSGCSRILTCKEALLCWQKWMHDKVILAICYLCNTVYGDCECVLMLKWFNVLFLREIKNSQRSQIYKHWVCVYVRECVWHNQLPCSAELNFHCTSLYNHNIWFSNQQLCVLHCVLKNDEVDCRTKACTEIHISSKPTSLDQPKK